MTSIKQMTPTDCAQKTALLCCHFARNYAYYSVFRKFHYLGKEGFWLTVHGNFFDICVLEWCKLFGNHNGKYHWKKSFTDPETFRRELLEMHGIDKAALDKLWDEVKNYRDNFVAHTEEQETTVIPNLNVPYLLVAFYFGKLQLEFPTLQTNKSLPAHFDLYYDSCLKEAEGALLHAKSRVHAC